MHLNVTATLFCLTQIERHCDEMDSPSSSEVQLMQCTDTLL